MNEICLLESVVKDKGGSNRLHDELNDLIKFSGDDEIFNSCVKLFRLSFQYFGQITNAIKIHELS